MLTREKIRKLARYSYARGEELYHRRSVLSFSIEEETQYRRIEARVKGSGRKRYEVSITIAKETDMVAESDCECPAFYSYDGLCKHCVAVLLQYIADRKRKSIHAGVMEKPQGRRRLADYIGEPSKENVPIRRQTTPQMKELLQKQAVRQALPLLQSEIYGKVRLEPLLTCTRWECTVEFRIGVTRLYVLKDVFAFARSMQKQEDYAYGRNLQFMHVRENFAEDSRPMADFLLEWVEKHEKEYQQNEFYEKYVPAALPKLRNVPLNPRDLEEFLDAVGEQPFFANVNGGGEKKWRVTKEELRRQVVLTGKPDGMEIALAPVFGYEGPSCDICFYEQRIYRNGKAAHPQAQDMMRCLRGEPGQTAFLQKEDIPAFARQILPALQECFDCRMEGIRTEELEIAPVHFRFYLDLPQRDLVTCQALAVYGEREYNVCDPTPDADKRDLRQEAEVGMAAGAYCNAYEEAEQRMVLQGEDSRLYTFLTEGVPKLQQLGEVYVSDALKKVRILQTPKVSVGISLTGDLLQLSLTSEEMSREQLVEILSRYERRRKFYRLKDGSFLSIEDESVETLQEIRRTLRLSEKQLRQEQITLPRYRMLYLEEELCDGNALRVQKDRNFRALIHRMKTAEEQELEIPAHLQETMREYQKQGYRWIRTLYQNGFGGILADDMGLGKTLQVICFLHSEMAHAKTPRRCLIVCPASLVYNWKHELEKFAPDLPVRMVAGTAEEREKLLKSVAEREILITSYELLRRDLEQYENLSFFCQVIDEAQYIKNHGTQAARAVKLISAGFKLALTGTPVENRLSELWSIFDYLMPGYLYGYQQFREELEQPIVQKGEEEAAVRLQKMIRPFVLRRLKKEVLQDLPEKLEENVYAAMEGEQQALYDAHVRRMQIMLDRTSEEEFRTSKLQILAELTKLRQLCCDPALLYENYPGEAAKKELAIQLIENAVENGHKVLLFSQFTSMLERLARALRERGISYHMLTGATPKEKRAKMVENFAHDGIWVFCISLKAGGTGLNLTAADVVVHFDPWWNVAVQNQATDRAHRIGQTNTVNVYRLIAKDTIEERIIELQERKRELADKILGGEGVGDGRLTKEELLELLR
ncbi:MAG: DEAD/DEAH box helicase [Eubacteriales bacterium]|nr:DEAD/DEAH box helicase [Eubacteriales bacterium]